MEGRASRTTGRGCDGGAEVLRVRSLPAPSFAPAGRVVKALAVPTASEVVQQLMHSTDQSVWTATALCLVLDGCRDRPAERRS